MPRLSAWAWLKWVTRLVLELAALYYIGGSKSRVARETFGSLGVSLNFRSQKTPKFLGAKSGQGKMITCGWNNAAWVARSFLDGALLPVFLGRGKGTPLRHFEGPIPVLRKPHMVSVGLQGFLGELCVVFFLTEDPPKPQPSRPAGQMGVC